MKICCRCEQEKDASAFTKDSRRKDGLRSYCKACERGSKATQRAERAPAVKASNHRYWRANARRINKRRRIRYAIFFSAGKVPAWKLAEKVGISQSRVAFYATRMGISLAHYRPRYEDEENARIIDMRKSGMTQKAIAETLGRPVSGVRAKLNQLKQEGML